MIFSCVFFKRFPSSHESRDQFEALSPEQRGAQPDTSAPSPHSPYSASRRVPTAVLLCVSTAVRPQPSLRAVLLLVVFRRLSWLVGCLGWMKACGGSCCIAALAARYMVGVASADVWQPKVNATWQWQLQFQVNTSFDVDMYDVDLFGELKKQCEERSIVQVQSKVTYVWYLLYLCILSIRVLFCVVCCMGSGSSSSARVRLTFTRHRRGTR